MNQFGNIVRDEWKQTEYIRLKVELDEFIIMPNHFHGIMIINDDGRARVVGERCNVPLHIIRPFQPPYILDTTLMMMLNF